MRPLFWRNKPDTFMSRMINEFTPFDVYDYDYTHPGTAAHIIDPMLEQMWFTASVDPLGNINVQFHILLPACVRDAVMSTIKTIEKQTRISCKGAKHVR
jgi:hypothetical protein